MARQRDERPPAERALEAVTGLRAGSWESVEALAMLAVELHGRPEGARLLADARVAASGLKQGTWESVRALSLLARAERELTP